jgi:hypothetical protein
VQNVDQKNNMNEQNLVGKRSDWPHGFSWYKFFSIQVFIAKIYSLVCLLWMTGILPPRIILNYKFIWRVQGTHDMGA